MEQAIIAVLRRAEPGITNARVTELQPVPGGFSRETFRCDLTVTRDGKEETLPLIIRKNPPEVEAILNTSRATEHELIEALRTKTTVPVSRSYGYELDPSHFGESAMVLERASGSGQTSALFNGGKDEDQTEDVIRHLCEVLAELHSVDITTIDPHGALVDPRGVGVRVGSWDEYMDTTFEYYLREYTTINWDPVMMILLDSFLTLRRNKPRPIKLSVVHGDFNPANFLYENGAVSALIDWENSRIGDPREDLGWMVLMDILSASNVMDYPKKEGGFLAYYNKITGNDITPEEIGYFTLFGTANIAVPVHQSVARRMRKEHLLLLPLYLTQSSMPALPAMAQLMGYPGATA
jgi:aminoglycoside phosphotransferase (APT) family kinase protein